MDDLSGANFVTVNSHYQSKNLKLCVKDKHSVKAKKFLELVIYSLITILSSNL